MGWFKKVRKEVNRVVRKVQINEGGFLGLPRFKWRDNGRSEGGSSFFRHGRTPEEEAAATRAEIEREIEAMRAVEAAAKAAAEKLAREKAQANFEEKVAVRASQIAKARVEPARERYTQAHVATEAARTILTTLNTQAGIVAQQVGNASNHIEQTVSHRARVTERTTQRITAAFQYPGGMDIIQHLPTLEHAMAEAIRFQEEAEQEAVLIQQAALKNQEKTQIAVGLADNQLAERGYLENEAGSYYNSICECDARLTNQVVTARQAATQKAREFAAHSHAHRVSEFEQQEERQYTEQRIQLEAANRVPAPTLSQLSDIDIRLGTAQGERQSANAEFVALEAAAQATAERLAREEAQFNVEAIVAERTSQVATNRVASAKARYERAQAHTQTAEMRLVRLKAKAEVAEQDVEKASDHMANTVAHRLLIEEKTELRCKDVAKYPGGSKIVEITSASELEVARVVSFQAKAEREAALTNQRETQEAVRLAEAQLAERLKLENEAKLYYEKALRDQADFANRMVQAKLAACQKSEELAPRAHRISVTFWQQAIQAAAKTEQQIQTEAVVRLPVVQKPKPFFCIDMPIVRAQQRMQAARDEMARLAVQTESQRIAIEKIADEVKIKVEKKSPEIAHNHLDLYQDYPTYLPECFDSAHASADLWILQDWVNDHEKHKATVQNRTQHEREAGVLAITYYAKIQEAAEISVEAIGKAESKLSHQSQLYEHEKQEKQKKFQSIRQELKRLQTLEIQAKQAVEVKIPNAAQFLIDDAVEQAEIILFDKAAQQLLIAEHEKVEAQLQAEQHAKKIKENQPIPRLALTAAQSRPLNPKESLDLILRYAWLAIIAQEHDIFHLTNPSISPERRIFLWDIMCIVSTHAPKAELSHSNHVRPGKKSLGHMQQFFSSQQRYNNSLNRITKRLNSNTEANAAAPMPATDLDLNSPTLQTAAEVVGYLKGKAQPHLDYASLFATERNETNDQRIEQDAAFAAFAKGVASIETVAKSMGTDNISTEMQEMRYEIRRQIVSNNKQTNRTIMSKSI